MASDYKRTVRRRSVVALLSLARAQNYTQLTGYSCGGTTATRHLLDVDTRDTCWDYCESLEQQQTGGFSVTSFSPKLIAAYEATQGGLRICCCATSCPCLLTESRALLGIAKDVEVPSLCQGSPDIHQLTGWDCAQGERSLEFPLDLPDVTDDLLVNEACWALCQESAPLTTMAISQGEMCRCYETCECTTLSNATAAFGIGTTPVAECYKPPEIFGLAPQFPPTEYTQVNCSTPDGDLSFGNPRVIPPETEDPRNWCWNKCIGDFLTLGRDLVAAIADDSTSLCWCYDQCTCLDVQAGAQDLGLTIRGNSSIPSCDEPETVDDPVVLDSDLYDSLYYSFERRSCSSTSGGQQACFLDVDYMADEDSDFHRYQCYNFCLNWYAPIHDGVLDASYGDPTTRECCCVTSCACYDIDGAENYLLALAVDGPTMMTVGGEPQQTISISPAPTLAPVPLAFPETCDHGSSKKRKNEIAPGLKMSDLWWIILLCIVCVVGIIFFLKVEEVDKYRRRKSGKEKPPVVDLPPPEVSTADDESKNGPPDDDNDD